MKRIKQTMFVKAYELPIEIAQEGEYFFATCPVWQDCYAQGKTIDEATSEIIAVASSLIELYQEEALRIPLIQERSAPTGEKNKLSFSVPIFAAM